MQTRRVQQGIQHIIAMIVRDAMPETQVVSCVTVQRPAPQAHAHLANVAGATAASTPSQGGQLYLPKSRPTDLIALSLAQLPNALSAEYWLNKIKVQEDLGNFQVSGLLQLVICFISLKQHLLYI